MTLFSIALKNIKKSIKDYSIFFITLVVAVSMLYMFNSLDAQQSMLALEGSKSTTIEMLTQMLGYVSVFVSIVFGSLIIFSNTFLIKRRKQEIGLYQVLGMNRFKVLTIIAIESIIVGIFSLIVGLITGVFLSQFMSMITAYMFRVDLSVYHFIFSFEAFKTTVINFIIIFGLVILLNSVTLARFKLIDLFNARRKNQTIKERPGFVSVLVFLSSLALIAFAYNKLYHGGITSAMDSTLMLVSGAFGTLILFYSIATFFTVIAKKNPKMYYKNLNAFVFKQINSKIKTSVLSTTIISLLLLLTIGILSLSIAIIDSFNAETRGLNMTDVSFYTYKYEPTFEEDIISNDFFKDHVTEYVSYRLYESDLMTSGIILDDVKDRYNDDFDIMIIDQSDNNAVPILKYSDYERITMLQGIKSRKIEEDEYMIICNAMFTYKYVKEFYETKPTIEVNGFTLKAESGVLNEMSLKNSVNKDITGVVVVHDKVAKDLGSLEMAMIANLDIKIDQYSDQEIYDTFSQSGDRRYGVLTSYATDEAAILTSVTLMFVGMYLGLTFAITSATVLAIGQLTDASDNKERYKVLRQLGAENKLINRALFTQIAIIFILPLLVAIVHSYVGINKFTRIIEMLVNVDMLGSVLKTAGFILIIYGGYMLLTYISAKKTISSSI